MQLVGQLKSLNRIYGVVHAVGGAFRLLASQHHLRVVQKILVDREAVLGPTHLGPVRRNVQRAVPFLQKENI